MGEECLRSPYGVTNFVTLEKADVANEKESYRKVIEVVVNKVMGCKKVLKG